MSGILRLESLTKGNTLKQGDLTLLKYRLFDADGDKLDISGKSTTVRLMKNDFTLIAYEKEGLTVAPDDTISFNINKILPGGLYHLEVIVDDKYIFPSRADEGKFNVDKSSLGAELTIIENAGIDAVVRKAVDLINDDPSLIIDEDKLVTDIISNTGIGNINEYYKAFNDLKPKAEQSITKSAEALTKSQNALNVANGIDAKATNALSLSESADTLSKSVQEQFNQVVIDGDSSVEAAQARVDASGQTNPTLKARLDKEHNEVTAQLAHIEYDSLVNRKEPKPMITWVDDDGNIGFYTKFYPLALEYGIPMTSGVITSRIGTEPKYISYEQYHEMARNGIEIVSHTHTHDIDHSLIDMTEDEMHVELSTAKSILKDNGWNNDVLVYPFGRENATVRNIVRQYHKAAIDVFYAPTQESENGSLARVGFDQFRIERVNADTRHDVVKQMMDKAVEDNAWIILMTHADQSDVWSDIPTAQANARSLIEYAQNAGLEFVTVDEGLKHHGNLAQFGNLTIDANGEVPPATVEWTEYSGFGYVDPSHIENYKFGNTRQKVRNADVSLFSLPSTNAGMVYTFRDTENGYSYQRFVSQERNSNEMLRFWNNGWTDWQTVGLMRRERLNEFGNNDPITSYSKGEVTIQKVTAGNSINFNLHNDLRVGTVAGIIYTYRDASEDGYSHQIYVGGSNILIKRNWNAKANAWTVWDYPGVTSRSDVKLIPANSPITSYPQTRFTITKLNTANTSSIGLSGYGILKTYRDSESIYSYQEFMNSRDNTIRTRIWDGDTNDWGAWSE